MSELTPFVRMPVSILLKNVRLKLQNVTNSLEIDHLNWLHGTEQRLLKHDSDEILIDEQTLTILDFKICWI